MRSIRSLSLLLATTLVACGGGGSTEPSDTYSGTYQLVSINGQSLPYVTSFGGSDKHETLSDALTLTDNGTDGGLFTELSTSRTTIGGQIRTESRSGAGFYTRNGTAVTFSIGGSQLVGTIGGGTITIDMVATTGLPIRVYRK